METDVKVVNYDIACYSHEAGYSANVRDGGSVNIVFELIANACNR